MTSSIRAIIVAASVALSTASRLTSAGSIDDAVLEGIVDRNLVTAGDQTGSTLGLVGGTKVHEHVDGIAAGVGRERPGG